VSQRPCWNEVELLRILKPDAEEIQDEVFHAVHCETELQTADTADGPRNPLSPQALVDRFLDPLRDYVQAVVLGESGTGKSHLIQWLRLNIPRDDATVLLTIPRTGTSLRGIVERVIAHLPSEERGPYEERLKQAGTQATSHDAKVKKFLSELAHAIEHSGLTTDPEDVDLASLVPSVLLDPNFRNQFFLQPGGTVDLIVQHVFDDPDARDANDQRREFRAGDLPLDGANYQFASLPAREAIDFIKGEEGMEARAIALMNLNRDIAIAQTLNFSADHLIELMNTLRRHLARQGKRLILLIEDFARVQGIDNALLQALITPPSQGKERLCEIRWAMAVTTGPFKRLEETVRSRTTIVVDMDRSKPASLSRLTAGYLNALRLGANVLNGIPLTERVPSYCENCKLKPTCTEAFGDVDGIGLFPFTETSIEVMARRTESLVEDGLFNPRRYMRLVLEGVLKHHYSDLEQGEYPSEHLLRRIGGMNALRPIDRQNLEQRDPANFSRRIALLELYDGTGKIVNLAPGLHNAFALPLLRDADKAIAAPTATDETSVKVEPAPTGTGQRENLPAEVETIRRWASDNGMLPQSIVNDLRQMIFAALDSYIDWDRLGMRKSAVASASSTASRVPFRQVSINFTRQQPQRLNSHVMLDISEDHAVSLEALFMYKAHSGWDFADDAEMMAHLLESLRIWGDDVTSQFLRLYGPKETWNPVVAVTELLTVANYLSGKVKLGDSAIESLMPRIWEPGVLSPIQAVSSPLASLSTQLCRQLDKLSAFLRNHASGTKGGKQGNFVRVWPVFKTVRALRLRSLELTQIPHARLETTEMTEIADLYRRVQAELPALVIEEKAARQQWLDSVMATIGDGTSIPILISALRSATEVAVAHGISSGAARAQLNDVLDNAKPNSLENALNHAKALHAANMADSILRIAAIGSNHEIINVLINRAQEFLSNAEASAANEKARLDTQSGVGLAESEMRIEDSLNSILKSLDMLAALPGGASESA
jgi:hypothetical protein